MLSEKKKRKRKMWSKKWCLKRNLSCGAHLLNDLNHKLRWRDHIIMKRKQIELRVKELYSLLGRKSQLSIENKLLIYKTSIKPIRTYGTEIWGCAGKSSQAILQKAQSKILRMITNAPRYVSNLTLHEDLKIPCVREVIFETYAKHHRKLETHPNPLLHPLPDIGQPRRLKTTQPVDLL
jgi:hypothetical protein